MINHRTTPALLSAGILFLLNLPLCAQEKVRDVRDLIISEGVYRPILERKVRAALLSLRGQAAG